MKQAKRDNKYSNKNTFSFMMNRDREKIAKIALNIILRNDIKSKKNRIT